MSTMLEYPLLMDMLSIIILLISYYTHIHTPHTHLHIHVLTHTYTLYTCIRASPNMLKSTIVNVAKENIFSEQMSEPTISRQ